MRVVRTCRGGPMDGGVLEIDEDDTSITVTIDEEDHSYILDYASEDLIYEEPVE